MMIKENKDATGIKIPEIRNKLKGKVYIKMPEGEHIKEFREYLIIRFYPTYVLCEDVKRKTKSSFLNTDIAAYNF